MPESFQTTKHSRTAYNRPDRKWICGGECKDCPCFLGPDRKGNCQAGAVFEGRVSGECLPRKTGDRWLCTRPDTNGGNVCLEGPRPDGSCCKTVPKCRPKRSLRSKRGVLAVTLSAVTAVWLVAILSPDSGEGIDPMSGLDPGPLSANHSFLETQCFRCHSDQEMTPASLIALHGETAHHRAIDDGKLCLSCHDTIGGEGGEFAFFPHTADKVSQDSTGNGKSNKLMMIAASGIASKHLTQNSIQCATCHQEHHGEEFNIATLSDKQCQTCHSDQFESFSNGHPEFSASKYPYSRRTGIRFDHYSHYQTHFPEELKSNPETVPAGFDPDSNHIESESCTTCHTTGKRGEPMALRSFEKTCATCHGGDTRSGLPLAFLAFPPLNKDSLDTALALAESPRSIGTWIQEPANTFPWPTIQLLSTEAREAWIRLRAAGVNPFDDTAEVPAESAADVETVAWAVKELARDLSQNQPSENPSNVIGQDELVRRLGEAGFPDPEALVKGFPAGAFDAMRQGFSKPSYITLLSEVAAKRSGTYPAPIAKEEPATAAEEPAEDTTSAPESFGDDTGESFGGDDSGEAFGGEDTGEAFGGEDTGEAFGGEDTGEAFGGDDTGEAFGGDDEAFGGGDEEFGSDTASDDSPEEETPKDLEAIDPVNWAARGGWYQQYGALYYRSTGHADPLLKNWLDALAARVDSPLAIAQLKEGFDFQSGVESKASGSCLKCHAVDEIRDDSGVLTGAKVRWESNASGTPGHSFTRYDHATHLLLTDCRSCHTTSTEETNFLTAFPESDDWDETSNWSSKADPHVFQSNFKAIMKDTCVECHQADKAGDSCIQCHFYHKSSHSTSFTNSLKKPN